MKPEEIIGRRGARVAWGFRTWQSSTKASVADLGTQAYAVAIKLQSAKIQTEKSVWGAMDMYLLSYILARDNPR